MKSGPVGGRPEGEDSPGSYSVKNSVSDRYPPYHDSSVDQQRYPSQTAAVLRVIHSVPKIHGTLQGSQRGRLRH
jgi:hypothetical protein